MQPLPRLASFASLILFAPACERVPPAQAQAQSSSETTPDHAQRRAAAQHSAAERFFAAAAELSWVHGWRVPGERDELFPPPIGTAHHRELRAAFTRATRERRGLDHGLLGPNERLRLLTYDALLRRISDRLDGFVPERGDATWYLHQLEPWLATLRTRVLTNPSASTVAFVDALAHRLRSVPSELGAGDPANLHAASEQLERLGKQLALVRSLARDEKSADAFAGVDAAIEDTRVRLERVAVGLPTAPRIVRSRLQRLDPKPSPRLVDEPLGATELQRVVRNDYGIVADAPVLLEMAKRGVVRYATMRTRFGGRAAGGGQTINQPVMSATERQSVCRHLWHTITEWASGRTEDAVADPNCDALAQWHASGDSPSTLERDVIAATWVAPNRARRHEANFENFPVTGWATRWLHDHTRTLAIAIAIEAHDVTDLEIDAGSTALCGAVAGVGVHTRFDEPALDAWLTKHCPTTPVSQWREQAKRDPSGSLRGLALAHVLGDPARMQLLDAHPWLPVGLLESFAAARSLRDPQDPNTTVGRAPPPASPQPRVTVEDL